MSNFRQMQKRLPQQTLVTLWSKKQKTDTSEQQVRSICDRASCKVTHQKVVHDEDREKLKEQAEEESEREDEEVEIGRQDVEDQSGLNCTTDSGHNEQTAAEAQENNGTTCSSDCCSNHQVPYQPSSKHILQSFIHKKRNFQYDWIRKFPWITLCLTNRKAYCLYCRHAYLCSLFTFSKSADKAFSVIGYNNWKKAIEKFRCHETSLAHKEACSKWCDHENPSIATQLNSQLLQAQQQRREGLLRQIKAIRFLARQGIPFYHHVSSEGNLHQLLVMLSESDDIVKSWLKENRFTSHQAVNEIITLSGQAVLRELLRSMRSVNGPMWFSVIADEATDVASNEQMSIVIRWVNDKYEVREDAIGLFKVPNTTAEMLFGLIKDVLIRCSLPVSLCRGQAYDGASNMQGIRSGVATRFRSEVPAALSVHCFAHNLNLCLQDASKKLVYIRDSLLTVREISNLIRYSPKRLHLFSMKLDDTESGVTLKPLCPTRWTARTAALDAILKDYEVLIETLDEIHETTHDEYGMKAGGLQQSLEKFSTLFGIKLCHLLFSEAEQVSITLQRKDITLAEGLAAVETAKSYYHRIRSEDTFLRFYESIVSEAQSLNLNSPELPRYRKRPARYSTGAADQHRYSSPEEYHRHQFYEACDLLYGELEARFDNKLISPLLAVEEMLISAANGQLFDDQLKKISESPFKNDVNISDLKRHLPLLPDVIKRALPEVKSVTSIRTICDALNSCKSYQDLLPSVHLLVRLYFTFPISSSTSERTFSALKRVLTSVRSRMTEKTLNNCLLLHIHKEITDSLDLEFIAKEYISINDERIKFFGSFKS